VRELAGHHLSAANPGPQRPFFQHDCEPVIASPQRARPFQAGCDGGVEVVGDAVELHDASHPGAGVSGCLEQPRDDTGFVDAELADSEPSPSQ
jgi:hypothetical protein